MKCGVRIAATDSAGAAGAASAAPTHPLPLTSSPPAVHAALPPTMPLTAGTATHGLPPLQPEQQVWLGAMSWKAMLSFGWLILFAIPLPLIIYAFSMRAHFQPHGLWALSLLSLLPVGAFFVRGLSLRTTTYRITNERISVLKGILSRESDDLQLMRVADVQFRQNLLGRLLNVGDLRVLSTDKTVPDLVIAGVESPAAFKEMLWNLVRERRRNMIAMEQLNQLNLGP